MCEARAQIIHGAIRALRMQHFMQSLPCKGRTILAVTTNRVGRFFPG
jgi:hypothetical protein